jgi:hypothetical protein
MPAAAIAAGFFWPIWNADGQLGEGTIRVGRENSAIELRCDSIERLNDYYSKVILYICFIQ